MGLPRVVDQDVDLAIAVQHTTDGVVNGAGVGDVQPQGLQAVRVAADQACQRLRPAGDADDPIAFG